MQKWKSLALERDDDFIQHFQNLAKELDMAIVITYLEKRMNCLKIRLP